MPLPPPGPPPGENDMMGAMPPMGGGPPGGPMGEPPGGPMGGPPGPGGGQPSVEDLLGALKLLPPEVKEIIIAELSKPEATGTGGAIKEAASARAGV